MARRPTLCRSRSVSRHGLNMAKKPKPLWGHRPPGLNGEPAKFEAQKVDDLAQLADLKDEASIKKLRADLNAVASIVETFDYIDETSVPVAQRRAALKDITQLGRRFLDRLRNADLDTRRAVFAAYSGQEIGHENTDTTSDREAINRLLGPDAVEEEHGREVEKAGNGLILFGRDIEHIERLTLAAEDALKRLPTGSGAPSIGVMRQAAIQLAEIYEGHTGREFHVSKKRGHDAAARFVETALTSLFPKATGANIRTALKYAVTDLQRRRNQKSGPKSG